ncbi:type III-A CRISPR-associated RAMP protein Csm5 [Benzoatithermus flavus]|uniref:CRISPR system Cms protein Csm5 n=1 Tax=Benzoatithermus flavus TaxID=3108223 RepID=A0ABU8XW62_9PROT
MTTHRFTAIPLTPIHVGDGSLLAPEDYLLDKGDVARFVPERVVADMRPAERQRFLAALDAGRLGEAQAILRRAVDPDRHVVERIALAGRAREKLAAVFENPLQRGEIRPFVRTAGRPYLPGSSLKGALRTALLDHFATRRQPAVAGALSEAAGRERRPGETDRRADALVQAAFDLGSKGPDGDPLRFVTVADALLPPGRTRIDLVENWKPAPRRAGAGPRASIPMQVERLLSRADGQTLSFDVRIGVDPEAARAAQALDRGKAPADAVTIDTLMQAVNHFAWRRFGEELEAFFAGEPATRALLEEAFRIPAGKQTWSLALVRQHPSCMLLRVGRFTQFESKSVDRFREGWNPQARRPIKGHGATRNVIVLATRQGEARVPLGWLLLVRRS